MPGAKKKPDTKAKPDMTKVKAPVDTNRLKRDIKSAGDSIRVGFKDYDAGTAFKDEKTTQRGLKNIYGGIKTENAKRDSLDKERKRGKR